MKTNKTNKPIISLGIYFEYDRKEFWTWDMEKVLDKITKVVERWQNESKHSLDRY